MFIFLDDKRENPSVVHNKQRGLGEKIGKSNNWVIARNYDNFVDIVYSNFDQIELISFDHDISSYKIDDTELTGKDAAQFVIDYCMDNDVLLPDWFVHSDNSGGNKNIRILLANYMFRKEKRMDKMVDAFGFFQNTFIHTY